MDDLILAHQEGQRLHSILEMMVETTGVECIVLLSRSGYVVSSAGETNGKSAELAALAAGTYASAEELLRQVGEVDFSAVAHDGARVHIYVGKVGTDGLLLALYDYRANPQMVRLQSRVAAEACQLVLEQGRARARRTEARQAMHAFTG